MTTTTSTTPPPQGPPGEAPPGRTGILSMFDKSERIPVEKKKFVYDYRPMYTIAFVICFTMLIWAMAFTIEQLSSDATARACVNAGGAWVLSDQADQSECQRAASSSSSKPVDDGATLVTPTPAPSE